MSHTFPFKMVAKYPCTTCNKECSSDCIQCSKCSQWSHGSCVPMTSLQLSEWSHRSLNFLCQKCCFEEDGTFNAEEGLRRLNQGIKKSKVKAAIATEMQLLKTYDVKLPLEKKSTDIGSITSSVILDAMYDDVDKHTVNLLKAYNPIILNTKFPAETMGDGNCLYRAISKAITGVEVYHKIFRYFATLEILQNPSFYDSTHKNFTDLVNDCRIISGTYEEIAMEACQLHSFSSMIHIYALSAVLGKPLLSYYPPTLHDHHSQAYNRKVVGRNARGGADVAAILMWTQYKYSGGDFIPNHFVPLLDKQLNKKSDYVDLDERKSTPTKLSSHTENIQEIKNEIDQNLELEKKIHYNEIIIVPPMTNFENKTKSKAQSKDIIQESDPENIQENTNEIDQNLELVQGEKKVNDNKIDTVPQITNFERITISKEQSNNIIQESDPDENNVDKLSAPNEHHPLADGTLHNSFLDHEKLIELIHSDNSASKSSIPNGIKNNVFFVLSNKILDKNGHKHNFSDDCGIWSNKSGSIPRTYFLKKEDKYNRVFFKDMLFCTMKKQGNNITYIPMNPQPDIDCTLQLRRCYSTSKLDNSYKRRVSWIEGSCKHNVIVEYVGTFPGLSTHGNSKQKTEYIRTPSFVMAEMSQMLKMEKPINVYNKLTIKYDEINGPSGKKQVHDKKRYDNIKDSKDVSGRYFPRKNLADHFSEIDRLVAKGTTLVKSIIRESKRAPSFILYDEEQIKDIKILIESKTGILGVDKTFNLCEMHVTTTCFKQHAVYREKTGEHPIFLGPVFIHDSSDFQSFSNFFTHLSVKLADTCTNTHNLVIGSDEEQALVNSIKLAFPEANHVLCIRHLYGNAKQKLQDDNINKKERQEILDLVFGENGLISVTDDVTFEEKSKIIEQKCETLCGKFKKYFQQKLKEYIKNKIDIKLQKDIPTNWTNNNNESLNHVLKQCIDWKSKPLLGLIDIISDIVETQYKDIKKALISNGPFRLSKTHAHFAISKSLWIQKNDEEKLKIYEKLRAFKIKDNIILTSTDGRSFIVKPKSLGKKLGQRKRKINERTITFKMKKSQ